MLDPDLVREVLDAALASGAGSAKVYAEERRTTSLRLDDGRIQELATGLDRGAGVRAVAGATTGYAYSNRLGRDALLEAARAAAAAARGDERVAVGDFRPAEPA